MIKTKSYDEMLGNALGYLQGHSPITMVSPGSAARSIVEASLNEVIGAYNTADLAMKMAYVSTASGYFLDLLGEIVGIIRRVQTYAYVRSSDRNIRFYVNSGTLGDYIPKSGNPARASVPAGTTIESPNGSIVYVVDYDHEAPASATEIWVTARAQTVGTGANVGRGVLSRHSLSNSVLVENVVAVTTGEEIESDEALRSRIRNAVITAQGANRESIADAAAQVPGVADVIVNEFISGAGSFELLLIPDGNRVPLESLMKVRSRVQAVSAFGIDFIVREPRYVPIAIDMELSMPNVNDVDKPLVRELVAGRISEYVGALLPGEVLRVERLRSIAISVRDSVVDVHIRSMRIDGKPQIHADYPLARDEVFIPDPKESTPFQVI